MSDSTLGSFSGLFGEMSSRIEAAEIQAKLGVTNLCNAPRSTRFAFDSDGLGQAYGRQRQRGYITVADDYGGARWKLRCLFNPPKVDYGFRVGAERFDTDREAGAGAFLIKGASVSFELFLDRSFELAQRPQQNLVEQIIRDIPIPGRRAVNNGFAIWSPQNIGVLHDIAVFNLVVVGDASYASGDSPGYIPETKKVKLNLSPGTIRSDQRLEFEGFITSTNVSFTRFTEDMVPMTAAMSISLQRTYDDTGAVSEDDGDAGGRGTPTPSEDAHEQPVTGTIQPPGFSDPTSPHSDRPGLAAPSSDNTAADYFERRWGGV